MSTADMLQKQREQYEHELRLAHEALAAERAACEKVEQSLAEAIYDNEMAAAAVEFHARSVEHIEARAEAALATLRSALEPFAEAALDFSPEENDGHQTPDAALISDGACGLDIGDLRRARAALAQTGGGPWGVRARTCSAKCAGVSMKARLSKRC